MSEVELICEKSFSGADQEIVDRFIEFHNALIESNIDKLNEIVSDDFEAIQIPRTSHPKEDFLSRIEDGSLDFSTCEIMEPTILFDDDNSASLIGKIRLTAKVNGRELRWISNTVASFEKFDGTWYFKNWEY